MDVGHGGHFEMTWAISGSLMSHSLLSSDSAVLGEKRENETDC